MASLLTQTIYGQRAERELMLAKAAITRGDRVNHLNQAAIFATKCEVSRR